MSVREQWDGGEWQSHCCQLLSMKHGEDIQFIPDRVRGDGGLEAYRLDDGIVYQCYAPKDAFTVQAQTDGQKSKINDDLNKLVAKIDETVALLGEGYLIRRWVLLTPEYDDKELVKYARKKSAKIRTQEPPVWCHSDFQIVISTDRELFGPQLASLHGIAASAIRLTIDEPTEEEINTAVSEDIIRRLTHKLRTNKQLAADDEYLSGYRSEVLLDYVYGMNQLEALQNRYSLAYDAVTRRARLVSRSLHRRREPSTGNTSHLEKLVEQLASGFSADIPSLTAIACEDFARHYTATWLIACPLRFTEES
ncbi:hypothetical protein ABT061_00435 [Streptosporangium sp. NPDC002544]|uniref:hypothetical protein n=1 Tax=Streptosporangium sp. NPDC002544 TaxID=3154538 RepID=UPI003326C261